MRSSSLVSFTRSSVRREGGGGGYSGAESESESESESSEEGYHEAYDEEHREDEGSHERGQDGGIGTPGFVTRYSEPTPPRASGDFQLVLPPFLYERRAGVTTTAFFPAFYLREEPGSSELVIPPVYHREGAESFDVVFPAFWWLRGQGHHTWIAGPVWHHEDPTSHDFGIAPLVMTGRHDRRYYHVLPPLLTAAWGDEHEDYLFAGGVFYHLRNDDDNRWGLFPLFWLRDSPTEQYQFVAPIFFRWRNPEINRTLTVIPPFYYQEDADQSFWGIAGLLHHQEGTGFHETTIPPLLFHYGESATTFRLSTPLFLYFREGDSETIASWVYQRYRGATEFDGVLPLFFYTRDPRDHSETLMATPLVWHWGHPGASNWLVFPFALHMDEHGRRTTWVSPLVGNFHDHETGEDTTWVAPTLQISHWVDGWAVNLHPIWYWERVPSHQYSVFAPVWWDFENYQDRTRYTVALPFFAYLRERESEAVVAPLVYYRNRSWPNEGRWESEIHISGLFDWGHRSDGEHWWRVLYGLIGWEHRATHDRLWLFYIPIDLNVRQPPATEPTVPATATPEGESAALTTTFTLQ